MVQGNFSTMGVFVGAYGRDALSGAYRDLFEWLDAEQLSSIPRHTVAFDGLAEALDRLADRSAVGKTVMQP